MLYVKKRGGSGERGKKDIIKINLLQKRQRFYFCRILIMFLKHKDKKVNTIKYIKVLNNKIFNML